MTIASKLVTLSADGATATVATATLTDVFTTALSLNSAVTGWYGAWQKIGLFALGGALDRRITTGAFGVPFMVPK